MSDEQSKRWIVMYRDDSLLMTGQRWVRHPEWPLFELEEDAKDFAKELVERDGWAAREITIRTHYQTGPAKAGEPADASGEKRSA